MTDRVTAIRAELAPIVESLGLTVYDVTLTGGARSTLAVLVDRPGGVDLDALEIATRTVSAALDAMDPVHGRYLLEVSSPGLERPLRTSEHFAGAVGETVSCKARDAEGHVERIRGTLVAARRGDDHLGGRDRGSVGPARRGHRRAHRLRMGPRPQAGSRFAARPQEGGRGPLMNSDMMEALYTIEREKGISVEIMLEALANALVTAYKRMPDAAEEALVEIDIETGDIHVIAQELDEEGQVVKEWDDTPKDFGRIAAQTAKQVILQRIREAEREMKYEEYAGREGDIVTGIIQQTDQRYTLLDLGKVEALLPQAEQVQNERYDHGSRLKAYIVEVRKTAKGPQIVVSRTHPGLVKRLFELEVPELLDGVVELRAVPGSRATAPRSRSRRTTGTSTRSARASVLGARASARSSPSCAARRSTSSRTPTTPPTS